MSFYSWPVMPSFVYITISGLMFVASIKTYKLKLLYVYPQIEGRFSKTFFYFTDTYLRFSKCKLNLENLKLKLKFFQN